jgi:hypothetical protein
VTLAREFEALVRDDDRFHIVTEAVLGLVCFRLNVTKLHLYISIVRIFQFFFKFHVHKSNAFTFIIFSLSYLCGLASLVCSHSEFIDSEIINLTDSR